jgi:hypothetical protein
MADPIRRLESGNVQVAGISSLPQPNMNFGVQRREISYQAAAEASSSLRQVISNLSASMFEQANKLADEAGAQFVAENPTTQEAIDAMVKGDIKSFSERFTRNAFGAAINKWRAHELSAHFESEAVTKANDYQLAIQTGKDKNGNEFKLTLKEIAEDWQATTKGHSEVLASYSPEASYKYRATAAVHGNKLLIAAAKADSERNFLKNQVKVEEKVRSLSHSFKNIIDRFAGSDPVALQNELLAERERVVSDSLVLGGIPAQQLALKESEQILLDVKIAMFQTHIFEGNIGDPVAFMQKIRDDKKGDLPPSLKNIWNTLSDPEKRKVRDAIDSEITALIKRKDETKKVEDAQINQAISANLIVAYDLNASSDDRDVALKYLYGITTTRPDLLSAKDFLAAEKGSPPPDIVDDFGGLAKLEQFLRENPKADLTTSEVLLMGVAFGVTPKTTLETYRLYAPKDATAVQKLKDLRQIEFDLRTKKIKRDDLDGLKNALAAKGMTLADAPDDFLTLLHEAPPEVEIKTDELHRSTLASLIQKDEITDPLSLYNFIKKNKYIITPSDAKRLEDQVIARRGVREAAFAAAGNDRADIFNSHSPTTNARNKIEGVRQAKQTYEEMKAFFNKNGYFIDESGKKQYRAPAPNDARETVRTNSVSDSDLKKINQQRQSLSDDFGSAPTSGIFSRDEINRGIKLLDITPTFKPGDPPKVDQNYRDKVTREFMRIRGITDPNKLNKSDLIKIQNLIDGQESIETKLRRAARK